MSSGSGGGAPAQEGGDVGTRHKSSAGGNPGSYDVATRHDNSVGGNSASLKL